VKVNPREHATAFVKACGLGLDSVRRSGCGWARVKGNEMDLVKALETESVKVNARAHARASLKACDSGLDWVRCSECGLACATVHETD